MNIDLLPDEEVLRSIQGYKFQINGLARLMHKLLKLIGRYSRVTLTLTSSRCIVEEHGFLFWTIPVSRTLTIVDLKDISGIQGYRTTVLFVIESYSVVLWAAGNPIAGLNLRGMDNTKLDAEIAGLSILKQIALK